LWFSTPLADDDRRPPLTRRRVVTQALRIIADDGVEALTMRTLAARLGVVPGALYRHVRNKEQLHDLVLDGVLAEVDTNVDPALPWTEQLKVIAHRLRAVLEAHPGVAGVLKARDPLGPNSLALAEAFLAPLHTAGFAEREAGLAFFLITDYTIGFAVSSTRVSANEQRVRDAATRAQLHEFFRTLPPDRFPALVALGEHVWLDNHDDRFTAGLDMLVVGLEQARRSPHRQAPPGRPAATTRTTRGHATDQHPDERVIGCVDHLERRRADEHRRSLRVVPPGAAAAAANPAPRRLPLSVLQLRLRARLGDVLVPHYAQGTAEPDARNSHPIGFSERWAATTAPSSANASATAASS
jgi:AcrR family transcriptional regulator